MIARTKKLKCSKLSSRNKAMKTLIGILSLAILVTITSYAWAEIPFDKQAPQEIKIHILDDGSAHVIHTIKEFGGTVKLEFIGEERSNLEVPCLLSCPYELDNPEQIFEESNYMVLYQYPAFQTDFTIEYDLENVIEIEDGLWKWVFASNYEPGFIFDDSINLVFVDSTPVNISNSPGFKCVGGGKCEITLEFFDKDISLSQSIYDVTAIQSNGKISEFKVSDDGSHITFNTHKKQQYLLIDIPTKMIKGSPNVYIIEENAEDKEQKLKLFTFEDMGITKLIVRSPPIGSILITNLDLEIPISAGGGSGGGCLIATAAYGSEMAPQVQFLREIRDNTVLQTQSGTSFMTAFNTFYYTFSPTVADYERENPVFKEAVKVGLTPLLTSLTILNYVDIDTEQEMLGYGIGIIMLNIGMYFVAPAVVIIALKNRRR